MEDSVMSNFESLDRQFRSLHQEFVKSYEEQISLHREQHDRSIKHAQRREPAARDLMRTPEPDQQEIDRLRALDKADLEDFLKTVRPTLVNRPSLSHVDAKRRAFQSTLQPAGTKRATVFATSLLSSDPSELAHVQGERGNPWVLPWNPGRIPLSKNVESHAWGDCLSARAAVFPKSATVWFPFLADKTGYWNIRALFNCHGFYKLTNYWAWLLCRFAEVKFDLSLDVYQYFWNGTKNFNLINRRKDSLSSHSVEYNFYDEYLDLDYQVALRDDSQYYVFVRAVITLWADAWGDSSSAEINFEDGSANYIEPVIVIASPL